MTPYWAEAAPTLLVAALTLSMIGCPDPPEASGPPPQTPPTSSSSSQTPPGSPEGKVEPPAAIPPANTVQYRWVKARPIFYVEGDTSDWYALFDAGQFMLEMLVDGRSQVFPLNHEDWNGTGEALEWRTLRLPLSVESIGVKVGHNDSVLGSGTVDLTFDGTVCSTEFNCVRGDRVAFRTRVEVQSISDGEATARMADDLLRVRTTFYARNVDEWYRLYNRGGKFALEVTVAGSAPQLFELGPEDWNRTLEDTEWKLVAAFPATRPVDVGLRILHDSSLLGEAKLTVGAVDVVSLTKMDCRSGGLASFTADVEFNFFRRGAPPPPVRQATASSAPTRSSAAWPSNTGDEMRDAFGRYCDANGLIGLDANPGVNIADGNGVLFTSEALVFLHRAGKVNDADRQRLVTLVRSLQAKPGVINRNPPAGFHETQEGWDDYIGLTVASRLLGDDAQTLAREVLVHGQNSFPPWFYNNERENLRDHTGELNIRATFGRAPWYIAHFYWCAGETPPEHLQVAWAACVGSYGSDPEDFGGWILQWLMIQALPDDAPLLCRSAARAWMKRFRTRFPEGIRGAMAGYFRDQNHPLIQFAPAMESERFLNVNDPLEAAFAELMHLASELLHAVIAVLSDAAVRVERGAATVAQAAERMESMIRSRTATIVKRVNETQERVVRGADRVVERAGEVLKRCHCVRAFGGCVGSCHGACGGQGCTCPGD